MCAAIDILPHPYPNKIGTHFIKILRSDFYFTGKEKFFMKINFFTMIVIALATIVV